MASDKPRKERWFATGLSFECLQCGHCCGGAPGYVWVTYEEILRMADFLKLAPEDFSKKYLRRVGRRVSLIEMPNYDCVFLQRTPTGFGCQVYSVRPQQCQTWPFWKHNLISPEAWLERTSRCPGVNRGKFFNYDDILAVLKESPC